MLAIHNLITQSPYKLIVANAFAKLSKCQQFTTRVALLYLSARLQTLLQSYQNVSNSQLNELVDSIQSSCKRFCKVIKMLAIHNFLLINHFCQNVANAFAKLSKCQQFTTTMLVQLFQLWLQTLLQSYQNVSNSQLQRLIYILSKSCKRFCKVIKMLAIHNVKALHN